MHHEESAQLRRVFDKLMLLHIELHAVICADTPENEQLHAWIEIFFHLIATKPGGDDLALRAFKDGLHNFDVAPAGV